MASQISGVGPLDYMLYNSVNDRGLNAYTHMYFSHQMDARAYSVSAAPNNLVGLNSHHAEC